MNDQGKYDDIATYVMNTTGAGMAIVIIEDGNKGNGFQILTKNTKYLKTLADNLEAMAHDIRSGNTHSYLKPTKPNLK